MPRNGSGVYSPPAANYPAVSGTTITAANRNGVDADIATALTNSLAVNGESVVTANIPMSGNKLTGLGAATTRTDAASIATIQDGTGVYSGTVGGTANVITITPSPAITAYVAGQLFSFIASGANTTDVTINVNGVGAKAVTKNGTTALAAGDIPSGFLVTIRYDGTRFQLVGAKDAFTGGTVANDISVPDEAYDATAWNGSLEVPTKNAVRDVFIAMSVRNCNLAKSGANLVLSPRNGNGLTINGKVEVVPSAGVSLAPPATTLTLYYIYAYMSAGVMTLEASTTVSATDTTTGIKIKSGDATRTLVGMARTVTNAWVDTAAQRFVRSWFNESPIVANSAFTATRATSSASYVELNTEIRCEILLWATDTIEADFNGAVQNTAGGSITYSSLGIDGTTAENVLSLFTLAGIAQDLNIYKPSMFSYPKSGLSEGYHYFTVLGKVTSGTGTWLGGASGNTSTLHITARNG